MTHKLRALIRTEDLGLVLCPQLGVLRQSKACFWPEDSGHEQCAQTDRHVGKHSYKTKMLKGWERRMNHMREHLHTQRSRLSPQGHNRSVNLSCMVLMHRL